MLQLNSAGFAQAAQTELAPLDASRNSDAESAVAPILTVGLDAGLHRFYESLFDGYGFAVIPVSGREQALESLRTRPAPVLISAVDLPDGSWRGLLLALKSLRNPPALVVAGPPAIWNEVLAAGGFDVLSTPWKPDEVVWTVTAAWHDWMNRAERLAGGAVCSDA